MGDLLMRREMMAQVGDNSLIYSMETDTELTGSNFIDTGIKLFDTNKDFTVEVWATTGASQSADTTIMHCCRESSPYPGLACARAGSNSYFRMALTSRNPNVVMSNIYPSTLYKIIVAYNSQACTFTGKINSNYKADVACNVTASTFQNTLLVGAYVKTDLTTYGRYFKGTIHKIHVWNRAFSNDEVNGRWT